MELQNKYPPVKRAVLFSRYKGTLPPESLKEPYLIWLCQKFFENIPFHNRIRNRYRRTLSPSTSATSTRAALRLHS